jgi:flagellar basal-body rod modification protein FlgD
MNATPITSNHDPNSLFTPHAATSGAASPAATNPTNASGVSSAIGSSLDENTFLNLLVTQLQNQDPTQPISDDTWVSELAQFSSLQETSQLNSTLTGSTNFTELTQAAGLVGKNVTTSATDNNGNAINGTVTSVSLGNNGVVMNIGTNAVTINQLTGFTN